MATQYENISKVMEQAKLAPVGVFQIDGKVKIIPVSQKKKFNAMLVDYSRYFIGVFDEECSVQLLKDNLV